LRLIYYLFRSSVFLKEILQPASFFNKFFFQTFLL